MSWPAMPIPKSRRRHRARPKRLGEERPLHRFLTLGVSLESSSTRKRPLSPFLTVYRWQYTMALSILHRVTGCALSVGLLLFVYWLLAAATGRLMYEKASAFFAYPLVRVLLIGFSFAFFYHLLNGVRHMTWDTGHGLERKAARLSGWIVFLGAVATTALFWVLIARRLGGAA
jgi:succinate dehydrogenase cytochrome b subunit